MMTFCAISAKCHQAADPNAVQAGNSSRWRAFCNLAKSVTARVAPMLIVFCAHAQKSMSMGEVPRLRGGGRGVGCRGWLIDDIYHTVCGVVNIIYQTADSSPDKTGIFRAVYLTKKQKDQNKSFWAFCFFGKYTDFRFAWGRVFLRTTTANSEDWAQKCPAPPNRKARTFGGLLLTTRLAGDGEQLHATPANAQDVAGCVRRGSNC